MSTTSWSVAGAVPRSQHAHVPTKGPKQIPVETLYREIETSRGERLSWFDKFVKAQHAKGLVAEELDRVEIIMSHMAVGRFASLLCTNSKY